MTHESTLRAAPLWEAGLNLLSSIYASEGKAEGETGGGGCLEAWRQRGSSLSMAGLMVAAAALSDVALVRPVGVRVGEEGLQPVQAASTNCAIDHHSGL